mmetsp:Transcript_10359/g.18002  ORF Transcript_10359/g.18002 Transcript_10359/m.18002 type:complete len:245 (-) Transcript_10359:558-1292(-)
MKCASAQMAPAMDRTHMRRVSASRRSEGYLTKPERPLGKKTMVGKVLRPSCSVAKSLSVSAWYLATVTLLPFKLSASSVQLPSIAWQKGHQGAYSTATMSLSRFPAAMSWTCALLSAATCPSTHKSRSAVRSSTVPSAFLMLPLCNPHSLACASSHHQRPSRSAWLGSTALVHGSQPMETYPLSCRELYGTFMTRMKFQTSCEVALDKGLYLIREPGPVARPSNAGSTCTTGTSMRVPGLWSLR